ncbi:autotransporter outer membrane beta-barrel domain-containing protein [Xanthobacter variabilis]|uniref:autotransporter outer membrane beta-barrel domain-containing protein n=1 Tax=Xanthobacter variabilis TaxID=3119932 RepID=UPI003728A06E
MMVRETKSVVAGGDDFRAPVETGCKTEANVATDRNGKRARHVARLATTLMFQSTALATSLVGLPVLLPTYSRAYGQASCSPSVATITTNYDASTKSITCTIPSGAVTQSQYAYAGVYTWYDNSSPHISQPGLSINIINSATIDVSSGTPTVNMIDPTATGLPRMASTQFNGVAVYSRGNDTTGSGKNVSGGDGGTLVITNYGAITNAPGAGIQAYSLGGTGSTASSAGTGGAGGSIVISSFAPVSAESFGIVAISRGGHGGAASLTTESSASGGNSGTVQIVVTGSVASTERGAGVLAASYGGDGGRTGNYGGGGNADGVQVMVGTRETGFSGSIATNAPNSLGGNLSARSISTGAAISAVAYGGDAYRDDGGNAGQVAVTLYGTSTAQLVTAGKNSAGIYALSYGGRGNGEDNKGGSSDGVTVTTVGSGQITTQGAYSSGIVAVSLGGLGQSKQTSADKNTAIGGQAGAVSVTNVMSISTSGTQSSGIFALSAGAGGGLYNNSSSGSFTWGDQNANSDAGADVTVTNHGVIRTYGVDSHGILAQSVGGGGGALSSSGAIALNANGTVETNNYGQSSTQQGVGGQSANIYGGTVTVTNTAAISTFGGYAAGTVTNNLAWAGASRYADVGGSIAILAQSIGGGGGTNMGGGASGLFGGGGSAGAGSPGGTVYVSNSGTLATLGSEAHGIVAQSIGGGGGAGRNKHGLFFAVGGNGGPGGAGGEATVVNSGTVVVSGDYASGVIVQSVGGGGGAGGKATTWGGALSVAKGGSGGSGGAGGTAYAHLTADSAITTRGTNGSAVLVQSIGGGGGTGGAAKATSASIGIGISLAFGGTGGGGGAGGGAKAVNAGAITTYGADAAAITVQSIGGGGGAGGTATAKSLVAGVPIDESGNTLSVALSFSHGGTGGDGGNGAMATASNVAGGTITTHADGSVGMLVQTIGGGGGAGGDSYANASAGVLQKMVNYATGASDPESFDFSVTVTLGGGGGGGGSGASASAYNNGSITTSGLFSDGIMLQSIGGGGGNATTGNGKSTAADGKVSASLSIGLGALGGSGGTGGDVYAGNGTTGTIATSGNNSRGMLVQSIGGGGGTAGGGGGTAAGTVGVSIGLGAQGSDGGSGGRLQVWNAGSIVTSGDWSDGILAQSVGGGGGMAGAGDSSITVPTPSTITNYLPSGDTAAQTSELAITAGESGGDGGNGGEVIVGRTARAYSGAAGSDVVVSGSIATSGILSNGITAQSIGGGGGAAAVSTGSSAGSSSGPFYAGLSLGASGGSGGGGGIVEVYAGNITTTGFASSGVVAQSIGGGGGTGAVSGFAVPSIKLNIGGSSTQASTGIGGDVTVSTLVGTMIQTAGDDAFGVVAQSIGGGGGFAAIAQGNASAASGAGYEKALKATLGGITTNSGSTGDAGTVTVDVQGSIQTSGARASGVLAQSIGGGGGALSVPSALIDEVVFQHADGQAGAAYAVGVSLGEGAGIVTSGDGAFGILAQSIGGGGGIIADTSQAIVANAGSSTAFTYASGQAAAGGDPSVSIALASGSRIVTTGSNAHGIFAQAFSGGGGLIQAANGTTYAGPLNRNGGSTGTIDVTVGGTIAVSGEGSWGIWAQSGLGTSYVTVQDGGHVLALGESAGGIYSASATGIVKVEAGGSLSVEAADAYAVRSGGLAETVTVANFGRIRGNIDLAASGATEVKNAGAATVVTGSVANVGVFNNYGSIDVGGVGHITTTTFSNDLAGLATPVTTAAESEASCASWGCQTLTYFSGVTPQTWSSPTTGSNGGVIAHVDVDMAKGRSDQFIVNGNLSGAFAVTLAPTSLLPGHTVDLFQVKGSNDATVTVLPTLLYQFTTPTLQSNGWYGFSVASANFTPAGWSTSSTNATKAAEGLNSAWVASANGGAGLTSATEIDLGAVFGLFYAATPTSYETLLSKLYSATSLVPLATASENAVSVASSVLSCPDFVPGSALLEEGSCVWGRALGGTMDRSSTASMSGFSGSGAGLQTGAQKEFADDWFLGGTIGYLANWYEGDSRAETLNTTTAFGAIALKHQIGPWLFALAGGGGYSWGESTRTISAGSLFAQAEGTPDSGFAFGRFRASYQFLFGDSFYAKPIMDLDVIGVSQRAYTETGAGALNLMVDSASSVVFGVTPAIEFGARAELAPGLVVRPYLDLGVSFFSSGEWTSRARFAGTPGMMPFETTYPIADTVGRMLAGVDLYGANGLEMKVQYGANIADDYFSQSGSLRLGYKF